MQLYTLQEEKCQWNLNVAISPFRLYWDFYKSFNESLCKRKFKNQNSLKLNSSYILIL